MTSTFYSFLAIGEDRNYSLKREREINSITIMEEEAKKNILKHLSLSSNLVIIQPFSTILPSDHPFLTFYFLHSRQFTNEFYKHNKPGTYRYSL